MARPSKYPRELRERAVRIVVEVRPDYPSEYQAMAAVAQMLGIGSPETVRTWMRRHQVDAGVRPGVTSEAAEELKRLRRENAELRRAISFGSGATPLHRSGLWVSAVVFGVVFGSIFVISVVADFATSVESGWHTLSFVGWAGLTVFAFAVVAALVAGVPRWWTWREVRRAHPGAIVLMCRRTISTAAEMETWAGRPGLSSGADEYFVLAASTSAPVGLDVYRIGRSREGIELNANHEALGFALVRLRLT